MGKYTRGLLAVILAVVLVLPAAAFAMLPEANARSSTGMDGPTASGPTVVDPDTSGRWEKWAAGHGGNKVTTQNVGRIWTDKTVEATGENEVSDFVTTLSAMSSTSNSTVTVTTPLDIVLVLDASGSMNDPMGGGDSTKRIDALKSAAKSFIDTIAKQNEGIEGVDRQHKVAIVKFAGDETDKVGNDKYRSGGHSYNYSQTMQELTACTVGGAKGLKGTIDSIEPAGATRADYGMKQAEKNIKTFGREGAKKVVVFFTDGKPTSYSEFDSDVANAAVTAAKSMKDGKATVYTIGIFSGANPAADPSNKGTSDVNKFMHAVSSNYPSATSYTSDMLGARVENSDYYKSATNADELKKVFDDISKAITSEAPHPTEIHKGYDATKSGYITFTDELGDFMQVDGFIYNGTTFDKPTKTEDNVDTYTFTGDAANLVITVQHAKEGEPQTGDIVTVKIPASLIPQSHFKNEDGKLSVDSAQPIRVKYTSSVKSVALDNLFTPEKVTGLKDYIEHNTTVVDGAPMPESATAPVTASVTKPDPDDKAAIGFGTIKYNEPGTYVYKVSEKNAGTTVDGIAYSKNVAEITVTVTPNKKGVLSADVKVAWSEADETEFKNVYTAEPVESSVTDKIDVTKSLTGRNLAAGEFSFELREIKGEDSELIETVANAADGKVTLSPIKYTEIGQHTYTLCEVKGNAGGIAYDDTVYTIVTTIADNGKGQLVATHELKDAKDAKDVKSIEFKNVYTTNAAEASLAGKKSLQVPDGLTPVDITGKFTFTVIGEEGAPMPASTSVHNDADGKVDFGKITFTLDDLNKALGEKPEKREHTFTYTVTESGEVAGVTNDAKLSREVSFTVTDDGEGNLRVSRKSDGDVAFTFTNTYNVTPVETSVTDQITANKVLTGRELAAGEFSFELVEGDKVVAKGTNAADGTIAMDKIIYDKPGKHTYTLREVKGGTTSKGITYSDAKYTIETTITDKGDGTLKAEHVLKDATAATFKNTYSVTPTDAELDFDLSKAIDGRDWTDSDEFSFTITAAEGTPLPDPATVTVNKHDAKDGIAAVKFGKIRYTAAGTYAYEIRENVGNAAGMAYDGRVATAEVTVTEDGEGKLTANVTKKENGRFTNTYRTELNYTAAGGLWLSKYLDGRPMTEGQFTFTVTPADDASARALGLLPGANSFKSPEAAEATVGLIDILAGHEVKFTQADAGKTFKYTVAEKNDGKPGYTYDDAVRTVTIAVADDGAGTLTATTTVSGGSEGTHTTVHKSGENKVESALVPFHNSYSATTNTPGGTAAQVVATKTLTGRPMADGEFWFGIAYQGELVGYENLKPNIGGHVSFDTLHYDTKMLANLEAAGLAYRTDKDGKLAWTINYTAYEDLFGLPNGVSATTWSFGFKVIVVDNGDGTLTATVDYGGVEPLFENVYGAEAVDVALTGTKKLQVAEGLAPADVTGKFTFTVTADEAGAPMPERTTVTNDAAGNVDFGKIHFTLEDLNRALGVTDDATDRAEADEADEVEADEAEAEEADADVDANADEPSDESEPAAPTAPRSHTFTYMVTESGSAPGVTNDANATRKVSYTVTDDGAGHLSVKREGDDGAAFTFTNTYSVAPTDSSVSDQVKTVKRLTGRDLAAGEFTFELLEDGVVVASGTNDASGNVTLNPIRYEAPGTHTYTLREACPNALGLYKGVTYDGATYTVVTTVSDNGDGTLTATHKLEGTTGSAGFTNKYHAMPTQVSIGAIKVLEGRELKKDEFSFKLVGEDIESTVTNDADGKINFDKFEYDEPGTYVYTISEVKGDEAGMTYDKSVFTATINVVDDGEGNLKASIAYTKDDKSVEGIVFNNTYKKPETPVPTPDPGTPKTVTNIVKTVKGFLPTTGDQQAAALLMAFVIAMAGVGALVWGIRKR